MSRRTVLALAVGLAAAGCGGSSSSPSAPPGASVPPASASTGPFGGNVVLGSPTATSIRVNVFSPDQGATVSVAYGTARGTYDRQTAEKALPAGAM